jgi:hypothetical protein
MRRARRWGCAALAAFALAGGARAEDGAAKCLPDELRMRAKFAEPKQLAAALSELDGARKRADKREVVARRFREAGCASVEEQSGAGLAEPNLVCRIPGKSARTIAVGSSPEFDGWASAALLPEIARAVASAPREHGYAIALLSRALAEVPAGARVFADALAAERPAIFLHLGPSGAANPLIGPESDERQLCALLELGRALGAPIETLPAWSQANVPCPGTPLLSRGMNAPLALCETSAYSRFLDVDPFVRAQVPVVGVYAFPKRERTNFAMRVSPRLDPTLYVTSYRLLAAYAVALDQLLAPGLPPE